MRALQLGPLQTRAVVPLLGLLMYPNISISAAERELIVQDPGQGSRKGGIRAGFQGAIPGGVPMRGFRRVPGGGIRAGYQGGGA